MRGTVIRTLVVSFATLLIGTSLVWAAAERISGTVDAVDVGTQTLTLVTDNNERRQLKAPQGQLQELERGDMVEVTVEGNMVKSIRETGDAEDQEMKRGAAPKESQ